MFCFLRQSLTMCNSNWPWIHYAVRAGIELVVVFLPQPPKCRYCRCWPPHLAPPLIYKWDIIMCMFIRGGGTQYCSGRTWCSWVSGILSGLETHAPKIRGACWQVIYMLSNTLLHAQEILSKRCFPLGKVYAALANEALQLSASGASMKMEAHKSRRHHPQWQHSLSLLQRCPPPRPHRHTQAQPPAVSPPSEPQRSGQLEPRAAERKAREQDRQRANWRWRAAVRAARSSATEGNRRDRQTWEKKWAGQAHLWGMPHQGSIYLI